MKTKVISVRDFASIKKMAQIVNPLVSKKRTIMKKIAALTAEIEGPEGLNIQIAGMEAGIKAKFLGLGTEQLVRKVVSPAVREDGTPILDAKTGKQLTKTTYEPTDVLKYDKEHNNYILTVTDEEGQSVVEDDDTCIEVAREEIQAQDYFIQQDAHEEVNNTLSGQENIEDNPFNI